MDKIYLPIPVPKIIMNLVLWFLLRYRKKHYGFPFRRIKLTKEKFAIVDPDDYQKLSPYHWQLFENKSKNYYAVRIDNGRFIKMHRVIMNAPLGKIVDHRNGEGLDNTKRNLRFATCAQNNYNVKRTKKGSSKYRGVSRHKGMNKWMAYISYNCKKIHLGYFENEEDAARAHDYAAVIYHGDFAVLNFQSYNCESLPREMFSFENYLTGAVLNFPPSESPNLEFTLEKSGVGGLKELKLCFARIIFIVAKAVRSDYYIRLLITNLRRYLKERKMYFLGFDIGSSSVKASLLEAQTGKVLASATSPKKELEIIAKKTGWAEQKPAVWWENAKKATAEILASKCINTAQIKAIGISYQMHGLVLVDKNKEVLRDAIIWCDSRAVEIGQKAMKSIGEQKCLARLLNSPGNFTASKLKWVQDNEPKIFSKIYKMMLPGDYIAMKMTGEIKTTPSGLSEGIMWDFQKQGLADLIMKHYRIPRDFVAEVVPTFSVQGELTTEAAKELGLKAGTLVTYRAGDQPNNALSLNVLEPGEIAATAGTSGVIYGVTDQAKFDPKSRVNTFVHVNHAHKKPRYGVLLCLNGTGILNNWLKHNTGTIDYPQMDALAQKAPIGSNGLVILPYGNGAERTLENRNIGASIYGLNFNMHNRSHLLRAAQEGIVFALNYGLEIMRKVGVKAKKIRAGNANMFLSPLFGQAFSCITETVVELYNTDGSAGAARGAGIGIGVYKNFSKAFEGLKSTRKIEPDKKLVPQYKAAYEHWLKVLNRAF